VFEDRGTGGDYDYNDDQFVFTNVASSVVAPGTPEPSTWAMMVLGFTSLGLAGWRAQRKTAALAV
jgi:PEP-CTERM motif